jgi:hypothetical protein
MAQLLARFVSGALTVLLTQALQSFFRRLQYSREKLLDRYAEFVAVASSEIERLKSLEAGIVMFPLGGDHSALASLDSQRHEIRRELSKISFQIRILESDRELAAMVAKVAASQPYMTFALPPYESVNYHDRLEKFGVDIRAFEQLVSDLVGRVLKVHAQAKFGKEFQPPGTDHYGGKPSGAAR